IWNICKKEHIPEEKAFNVATIVGDVLFGFLHAEDVLTQIKELGVPPEVAGSISREIDKKIFAPVRPDIEKNYSPITKEDGTAKSEIVDLKVDQIKTEVSPQDGSEPAPLKIEQIKTEEFSPTTGTLKEEGKEGPAILQKEVELPKAQTESSKKSLGGLFGFLRPQRKTGEIKSVEAQIKLDKETPRKLPVIEAKTEFSKPREIYYSETPVAPSPFGKITSEIKKEEVVPFSVKIEKPITPTLTPEPPAPEIKKEEKPLAASKAESLTAKISPDEPPEISPVAGKEINLEKSEEGKEESLLGRVFGIFKKGIKEEKKTDLSETKTEPIKAVRQGSPQAKIVDYKAEEKNIPSEATKTEPPIIGKIEPPTPLTQQDSPQTIKEEKQIVQQSSPQTMDTQKTNAEIISESTPILMPEETQDKKEKSENSILTWLKTGFLSRIFGSIKLTTGGAKEPQEIQKDSIKEMDSAKLGKSASSETEPAEPIATSPTEPPAASETFPAQKINQTEPPKNKDEKEVLVDLRTFEFLNEKKDKQ
ncbi:hypothetical protein HY227_02910, partial [Candidatus Wolfebacteria bacterium]|nr:hypothetical protein [Candidatus Wolfebacteria bacterium]